MISKKILNAGLATFLVASFATSANAGGLYEKYKDMSEEQVMEACPKAMLAKAPKRKVGKILEVDFTDQPEVCAAAFAKTQSSRYQVIMAERQEQPWRTETLEAAREINEKTGKPIFVGYYKDVDLSDKWAKTSFWAWGHERASYELEDTFGIDADMVERHDVKNKITRHGIEVQQYKNEADGNLLASTDSKVPSLAAR